MSNRYLYRAKRTDNGEWVEGFYAVAVDTGQAEKRYVYIQHSLEIWHGAGKQRAD